MADFKEVSLSFGIEEAVVAEVFERHHPCTRDVLETLTIQVLAESIHADLATFTHTIRERQRQLQQGVLGNTEPTTNVSNVSEGESLGERAKAHPRRESETTNPGCKPEGYHPRDPESDDGASGGLAMPWQAAWVTQR